MAGRSKDKTGNPKDSGQQHKPGHNYGNGNGGLGSRIEGTLANSFPGSPVFKGEIPGWEQYHKKVMRGRGDIVSSGQDFQFVTADGSVPSRTYLQNGPPVFEEVEVGSRGKPGSPWTPNTSSPRGGTTNPKDLPAPPLKLTSDDAVDNYGSGEGGTKDPSKASSVQLRAKDYFLGKWG